MNYFDKLIQIDQKFSPAFNARGMVYDKMENYELSYT